MEASSTPLADYFWIAGVESIRYDDQLPQPASLPVESTITEDGEPQEVAANGQPKTAAARHSRQNSANRLSRISSDGRFSIHTLDETDGNTRSNRSSATIKAVKALFKFAAERENFLEDLSFTAGAKTQARPPMVNPRAERIRAEESIPSGRVSPLKSIKGSIRRKISFRDMNSMRKPPSSARPGASSRAASVRTAKRLSNYNSVIPPPEPLNTDPDMHPLKRRFEPVLLDRYPPKTATDEIPRRGKFPDYVPMFAFPNDIQIVSSDDRPRSTWHGFTMTSEDNSKLYGITIIIWTALTADVAEDVETKCEQWRQNHMSNEERELAASLGIRLAGERSHLSHLLSKLPTIPSGSPARDRLEDEISTVEEKISLMTDMLRPLRHGAASKIEGLTAGESGLWAPRAYGILGRDPANMGFWKEWLKAILVPMTDGSVLRVLPSSPKIGRWQPLERYVVNMCTEAFTPLGSKTQVELGVRDLRMYSRREASNELPGSRTIDLYALFRCLSLENVVALFGWASIFIPVLPARLISALEAPCPYIVGVERRYERIDLPDDDYVLVDLDRDTIDATSQPHRLPRQHRRKLMSLLQVAAPHTLRYGVTVGPPPYAIESFPYDAFSSENGSVFTSTPPRTTLGKWVTQNSSSFAEPDPQPTSIHPSSTHLPCRQSILAKRTGPFHPANRPALPFLNGHQPNASISGLSVDTTSSFGAGYAPSAYAQSTLAASTIMPNMQIQPVQNTETTVWVEGHCFSLDARDASSSCTICDEKPEGDGMYQCNSCKTWAHGRCLGQVSLVCPEAFHADRVRAAFVRCMASLLYTYRKYLGKPSRQQKNNGQLYAFDMDGFIKSLPYDQQEYTTMLRDTQGFNEFIHHREMKPASEASVRLFDEIIMAKKARGRTGLSSGLSRLSTIRASHGASANTWGLGASSRTPAGKAPTAPAQRQFPGEYRSVVTRIPSRLDRTLMREPRAIQGVPRMEQRGARGLVRKQVPSMLGTTPPT
ncbi:hypothetical protein ACCO45_005205 [Purpureocillium lilacinum]|uniref:Uncharacterized protein n=1 Tax=Purpureocillium lilacinum TaxID=33203 RepID=A0ACC4DVF4_PURLI